MLIQIQASRSLKLSQEEIKGLLTADQLAKVKGKTLAAYTIAEEGEATPNVIGEGATRLTWPRAVIRRIQQLVRPGTKLFPGHNTDNSTKGRTSVGEILATTLKDVGGKLRTIAVACMDNAKATFYDVCSIEANARINGSGIVEDVDNVTGVAVANGNVEQPAFPGARRIGLVQCFGKEGEEEPHQSRRGVSMPVTMEDLMAVPLSLIKTAIQAREVHPGQLFSETDMRSDNVFGKVFTELESTKTALTTKEKELQDKTNAFDELTKATNSKNAETILNENMPKDATDLQKWFLKDRFNPSELQTVDEESVKGYITDALEKSFPDFAKTLPKGAADSVNEDNNSSESDPDEVAEKLFNE